MHPELIPGWPLHSYGLMLVVAFYSAYFLSRWTARKENIDPNRMLDILLIGAVLGIVGARAMYVIQYKDQIRGFIDLIAIWNGGLVFYGGLVTATIGLAIYIRRHKLPFWKLADAAAPAIMLGLAFGRIGCFLNGCCWGAVCDEKFPLAVRFPQFVSSTAAGGCRRQEPFSFPVPNDGRWHAVDVGSSPTAIIPHQDLIARLHKDPEVRRDMSIRWLRSERLPNGDLKQDAIVGSYAYLQHLVEYPDKIDPNTPEGVRSLPVHPTQLYSSFAAFFISGTLLVWRRRRRRPGEVFALMTCTYSVARFLIESVRNDTAPVLGSLTMGQATGIPIFVVSLVLLVWFRWRGRRA